MPKINVKASVGMGYSASVVLLKSLHSGGFFTMELGSPLKEQFFTCHIGKFSLYIFSEFFFSSALKIGTKNVLKWWQDYSEGKVLATSLTH